MDKRAKRRRLWPSRKLDDDDALFVFCEQEWTAGVRRFNRALPSSPRCKLCRAPFGGVGRFLPGPKFSPSRKNPNFCKSCFEQAPVGCRNLEIGVLFADMRGYTSLSESLPSGEMTQLVNRFYRLATELLRHDAVIDKLIGDEVMALFIPAWTPGAIEGMVSAAEELLRGVGFGSGGKAWLPIGVGVDYGTASVGNVGPEEIKDFTAIGNVVNTAARLAGYAGAGQLVMSERVRCAVQRDWPMSEDVEVQLKGKSKPMRACVVSTERNPRAPA